MSFKAEDFDQVIERYHLALGEFMKGNPATAKKLYSQRDDVTLGNPFGPFACGWKQVVEATDRAASNYSDGDAAGVDTISKCVTADLAYLVEVERLRSKVGGRSDVTPLALRATTAATGRQRIVRDSCMALAQTAASSARSSMRRHSSASARELSSPHRSAMSRRSRMATSTAVRRSMAPSSSSLSLVFLRNGMITATRTNAPSRINDYLGHSNRQWLARRCRRSVCRGRAERLGNRGSRE